jgi:hypothetical protein
MIGEIRIRNAVNGYAVTSPDIVGMMVFEVMDTEHGEIECFKRLLYSIVDHFGMTGSKHDARRIRITTGGEDE